MHIFTIFENTSDHPGKFVVRSLPITAGGSIPSPDCKAFDLLEEARSIIPKGREKFSRSPKNDSCILESWL